MVQLLRAAVSRIRRVDCTTLVLTAPALTAFLLTAVGAAAAAQFASSVNLVEVYVSVTDRTGSAVLGLTASDFTVTDDGTPQRITAFAAGEFPLSVALAVDRSFSMAGERLATAKRAGRVFLDALRPDDQAMLIAIGSETEQAAPLSRDHRATDSALQALDAWGTTPLYDAIVVALNLIDPPNVAGAGRRALVILSDGTDRGSRAKAADVLAAARRHNVLIYPIALARAQPPLFAELAVATGGHAFQGGDPARLDQTLTTIARELRLQYLLGYTPRDVEGEARWHAIEVTVDRPGAHVRARDGYWTEKVPGVPDVPRVPRVRRRLWCVPTF